MRKFLSLKNAIVAVVVVVVRGVECRVRVALTAGEVSQLEVFVFLNWYWFRLFVKFSEFGCMDIAKGMILKNVIILKK